MSAHIAMRCDECGKVEIGQRYGAYADFNDELVKLTISAESKGWSIAATEEICPFCASRRKAKQQVEAAAK